MTRAALFDLLFSFKGRINRAKIWLVNLAFLGIYAAFAALFYVAIHWDIKPLGIAMAIFGGVSTIVFAWAWLATTIKRLHDRDFSGWMILFFYFLPGFIQGIDRNSWFLWAAATPIGLWGFVEIYILRGTSGPNDYGPDPLNQTTIVADKPQNPNVTPT